MLTVEAWHRDRACDEHAHCPLPGCGALMSCDATGTLVCPDCRTDAVGPDRVQAEVTR